MNIRLLFIFSFFLVTVVSRAKAFETTICKCNSDTILSEIKSKALIINKEIKGVTLKDVWNITYAQKKVPELDSSIRNKKFTSSIISRKKVLEAIKFIDSLFKADEGGEDEDTIDLIKQINSFLDEPQYKYDYYFENYKLIMIVKGEDRYLMFQFGVFK